jgi:hypothetical protein
MFQREYERTSIFQNQKTELEKIAKGKRGISVAELVRRIIDQDLDREPKQKA